MTEPNARNEEYAMDPAQPETPHKKPDPSRRSFLKAAPLGALAAVAGGAEAKPKPAEAAKPAQVATKRGYHETDHIRRYYQTAAYW